MRHFGFSDQVTYFPKLEGNVLANVQLGVPTTISDGDERLFRAIFTRHTNRGPFQEESLPSSLVHTLRHDNYGDGIRVYVLEAPEERHRLVKLIRKGNLIKWDNRNYRREMAHWVRPNNSESIDGLTGNKLGLSDIASRFASLALPLADMAETQAERDGKRSEEAPALLVLATDRDAPDQWLKAGEALAKVLLRANSEGLQASYFNQPIELLELRPELQAIIGQTNYPQLLFRLGYPSSSSSITQRRSPSDVQVANH